MEPCGAIGFQKCAFVLSFFVDDNAVFGVHRPFEVINMISAKSFLSHICREKRLFNLLPTLMIKNSFYFFLLRRMPLRVGEVSGIPIRFWNFDSFFYLSRERRLL